eukprot:jgi/Mesen1/5445/ME000271S04464
MVAVHPTVTAEGGRQGLNGAQGDMPLKEAKLDNDVVVADLTDPSQLDPGQGKQTPEGTSPVDESPSRTYVTTPPFGVDGPCNKQASSFRRIQSGERRKGAIGQILQLLQGFAPGSDVTKLQVPPQFNMPKSQLQLHGESVYCFKQDLLSECAVTEDPLDRFIAVVKWHVGATRHCPFGKAPYNPVLGETHHASSGDLNVLVEQVCHHPPISALYATNDVKKIRTLWWHYPVPRFYGAWLKAEMKGKRLLFLDSYDETYELQVPSLLFRFLPSPRADWEGNVTVKCEKSGYEAQVCYKTKPWFKPGPHKRIEGEIYRIGTKEKLIKFHGHWDKSVTFQHVNSGAEHSVMDCLAAASDMDTPQITLPKELAPTESLVVWADVTEALLDENWNQARNAKSAVERAQREARSDREQGGADEKDWEPSYFSCTESKDWVWKDGLKTVPPAPVRV